jgi:SAM-dependent methyltransferase
MENYLDDVISSTLTESRINNLPLMWNEANYHDGVVDLSFSVFDPYHLFDPKQSTLTVNGQNQLFDYHPNNDFLDLAFSLNIEAIANPFAQIDFSLYPHTKPLDSWRQSWFIPLFVEKINLPDAKRLLRVIGDTRTSSYLVGGSDHAKKISLLIEKNLGLPLDRIDVLDWGCGCGRTSQLMTHIGIANLVGVDIDQDNVQWCKDNIKGATFYPFPYYPPTELADESFDVVYGISVMTHLTEETHKAWLQEIRRILRPGGFALLSVRGSVYHHLSKSRGVEVNNLIAQVEHEGFVDLHQDSALAEVISEQEYYRAAFCSRGYIRRVWSQYFHVIDIVEGLVLQDMIVLQKPQSD